MGRETQMSWSLVKVFHLCSLQEVGEAKASQTAPEHWFLPMADRSTGGAVCYVVELQGEALRTQMFHTWKNLEDLWIGSAFGSKSQDLSQRHIIRNMHAHSRLQTTYRLFSLMWRTCRMWWSTVHQWSGIDSTSDEVMFLVQKVEMWGRDMGGCANPAPMAVCRGSGSKC